MKNIKQIGLRVAMAPLLAFSWMILLAGCNDNGEQDPSGSKQHSAEQDSNVSKAIVNQPFKITLTAPAPIKEAFTAINQTTKTAAYVILDITSGNGNAADYIVQTTAKNWTNGFSAKTKGNTVDFSLAKPAHGETLQALCNVSTLKSGEQYQIPVEFRADATMALGKATVNLQIVDKAGKPVSNSVTLAWKTD